MADVEISARLARHKENEDLVAKYAAHGELRIIKSMLIRKGSPFVTESLRKGDEPIARS
jgi:hypothetical protein